MYALYLRHVLHTCSTVTGHATPCSLKMVVIPFFRAITPVRTDSGVHLRGSLDSGAASAFAAAALAAADECTHRILGTERRAVEVPRGVGGAVAGANRADRAPMRRADVAGASTTTESPVRSIITSARD